MEQAQAVQAAKDLWDLSVTYVVATLQLIVLRRNIPERKGEILLRL